MSSLLDSIDSNIGNIRDDISTEGQEAAFNSDEVILQKRDAELNNIYNNTNIYTDEFKKELMAFCHYY